ncbi:TetR-like C-terminal domain-containing protein [Enterococcus durans]
MTLRLIAFKQRICRDSKPSKKSIATKWIKNVLSYINIKFETEIEKHYLVIFFSNAAFGLLQEWINNGQKESPEELVRILNKIVPYKFI